MLSDFFYLHENKGFFSPLLCILPQTLFDVFFSPSLQRNRSAENTDRRVKVMPLFCPAAKEHLVQLHCVLMCVYVPAMNADGLLKASEGERYEWRSLRILHAARASQKDLVFSDL